MPLREQTVTKFKKATALIDNGMAVESACKKVGMGYSNYYLVKKRLSEEKAPQQKIRVKRRINTNKSDDKVVVMVCRKNEARRIIDEVLGED